MNRLETLFKNNRNKNLLSIYYTAGYPTLESTVAIAEHLQQAGVDFLEIGFPYSDPVADGPVIQQSSTQALDNGMSLKVLFSQLSALRKQVQIPVLLMGYINPVLQFGMEHFLQQCQAVGVDGVILPDLPLDEYEALYIDLFKRYDVRNIFLITPQTSEARIRKIDGLSQGFIYMLSSSATTGKNLSVTEASEEYFKRIQAMRLQNPRVIGFGISDRAMFLHANRYAAAAIVGSAFVRQLEKGVDAKQIQAFVHRLIHP